MQHLHGRSAVCVIVLLLVAPAAALAQATLGTLTGAINAPGRSIGEVVLSGDRLQTGPEDRLMVSLELARGVLCLAPGSNVTLTSIDSSNRIKIDSGMVRLYYSALQPGQAFELETPLGTMTLKGSIVWAGHDPAANTTVFAVEDTHGAVDPKAGTPLSLNPGQMVRLTPAGPGEPMSLSDEQVQAWQRQLQLSELMMSQILRDSDARIEAGIREAATTEQGPETAAAVIAAAQEFTVRTKNQRVIDIPALAEATAGIATDVQAELVFAPPTDPVLPQTRVVTDNLGATNVNGQVLFGIDQVNPVSNFEVDLGAGAGNPAPKSTQILSKPVSPGAVSVASRTARLAPLSGSGFLSWFSGGATRLGTATVARAQRITPVRPQR